MANQGAASLQQSINLDPMRYREKSQWTFTSEAAEAFGIVESDWEPLSEDELFAENTTDAAREKYKRQPLSFSSLRGVQPARLAFTFPQLESEMNDAWFEFLFKTLRDQVHEFSASHFRAKIANTKNWNLWGNLSSQFLHYASDTTRKDDCDGGWDRLLIDPLQRSYVVMGIVAKILDEHVFSNLLFGGEKHHQDALSQWDRIMMQEEGYYRKIKRAQEVRQFCDGQALTPRFWDEVDRLTAEITTILLPLLNMQRKWMVVPDTQENERPLNRRTGIFVLYQQLHDIVALAGYASLSMARSVSIFQFVFPMPGLHLDNDQNRLKGDVVFEKSVVCALQADRQAQAMKQTRTDANGQFTVPFNRIAKIKIVLWPKVDRYKPLWDTRTSRSKRVTEDYSHPSGDTVVNLTKSQSVYYAGKNTNAADTVEGLPTLEAHVKAARRKGIASNLMRRFGYMAITFFFVAFIVLVWENTPGLGPSPYSVYKSCTIDTCLRPLLDRRTLQKVIQGYGVGPLEVFFVLMWLPFWYFALF